MAIRARTLVGMRFDPVFGPQQSKGMGEEVDLLLRLYRNGEQFIFVPDAQVTHVLAPSHVTTSNLTMRAYRSGRGNARLFWSVPSFPLFGVPLHQMKRFVSATLRMAVSQVGPRRDRLIAAMEWHQVRGNIRERIEIRRDREWTLTGLPKPNLFPTPHAIWTVIKRRGLGRLLATPLVWALRPLVRLESLRLFETSLALPVGRGERADGVTIQVLRGFASERTARVALCRLEAVTPEEVERRMASGDSVAIASLNGKPIAYSWCTFSDIRLRGTDACLRVAPTELIGYDDFVLPTSRDSRILSALHSAQIMDAEKVGRKRHLVLTGDRSHASFTRLKNLEKTWVFTHHRLTIRPLGWRRTWTRGEGTASRVIPC